MADKEKKQNGRRKDKFHLNIVVVGPVEVGKSTLIGQTVFKCGGIEKATILRFERESTAMGKPSNKYAWVVDKLGPERERGHTIDVTTLNFITTKYYVNILNAPGQLKYRKNLVTAISLADCAVLVVDASPDEFEKGMSEYGDTRNQALLCYMLGVKQMIVLVNKMDKTDPPYSQDRYEDIKEQMLALVKMVGYGDKSLPVVPITAFEGDNLIEASTSMPWYQGWTFEKKDETVSGGTFLEAIDAFSQPERPADKPLRIIISDVYTIGGIGLVPVGCVVAGKLKAGMTVTFSPSSVTAEVKSVEMNNTTLEEAVPGDMIGFNIKAENIPDGTRLARGHVAGDSKNDPPKAAQIITAKVIILPLPGVIRVGYRPVFDFHTAHVACTFVELLAIIDRRTGETLEDHPKSIKNGDCALVKLRPIKEVCVEAFDDCQPLGRFIFRDNDRVIGGGMVGSVEKVKN